MLLETEINVKWLVKMLSAIKIQYYYDQTVISIFECK